MRYEKLKEIAKRTSSLHLLFSLLLVLILCIFDLRFAREFLYLSFVFNLYIRALYFGFDFKGEKSKTLMGIVSALRSFLTALLLSVLYFKFKISLASLALAFVLYKLVLVVPVIWENYKNGNTSFRN